MENEKVRYRTWISQKIEGMPTYERINSTLNELESPILATSVEVLGIRRFVYDDKPKLRLAFGTIKPQSLLVEELQERKGLPVRKLGVPYDSYLYWNDAVGAPLSVSLNKGLFVSKQNFGAELLDRVAGGIKQIVELLPRDFETLTKFSVIVGNKEAQERLQLWANLLGMDLQAAQNLLRTSNRT